ncbi:unnamed protein product [Pleuronectes platessa]|uniref:Uncharacterized protein n=1 Tax=Pleuronectes platessa TaxID=8262 RepID=A0A9N7VLN9_PLEPL|nr:unnamed protein product [Pleuronectes platessa]
MWERRREVESRGEEGGMTVIGESTGHAEVGRPEREREVLSSIRCEPTPARICLRRQKSTQGLVVSPPHSETLGVASNNELAESAEHPVSLPRASGGSQLGLLSSPGCPS